MKKLLSFLSICLLVGTINAQFLDEDLFRNYKPRNIGPAGMSGRVTSIDVDLSNPNRIFIGTASGGVWKSESGGTEWTPLFDKQSTLNIGSIAIQQSNPDVIWAGTGEGNPRNSQSSGNGIYKSIDGGKSWKRMGLDNSKTIHRIIIHSENPDIVFVGATGSAWGSNEERGVFKTTDGGLTWKKVLYINDLTGCADLIVDPNNPNKLIAAMWEYQRWPWSFNSGGNGSGIYLSVDGGESWQQKTENHGLPKGELGRIGLSFAPSSPNIIYALVEAKKRGLYKSIDGGYKWTLISSENIGNRPFYYSDLFVDPQNENRIYNLHSTVTKSEDGGKTFSSFVPWHKVHPDHHAFWIHPDDPNYIILGNDGGLAISRDKGATWRFVENLPVAQFYHINVDNDLPYNIYGGMQDNGSWVGPGYQWKMGGIRNADWQEVMFGDGFDVVPDTTNNRYGFAMWQGGNLGRYDRETGKMKYCKPLHPDGISLRFNWNAAIAQDPFLNTGIYFGSQFVHYSKNNGDSWEVISPDLTTNDPEKQKQAKSGGLTIDATQAENFTSILCIAPSKINKEVVWVGTDDGNIQLTKDGGLTWNKLSITGMPEGAWVPQIEVSTKNEGEAFVVVNDYRRNNWKPYLFYTSDYGINWKQIASESTIEGYCLSIVQDPKNENLLFLGTEQGLYFSFDKGAKWQKWNMGFPSVSTMDLKIQKRESDLVIGTFGRAAWVLDNIEVLREIAKTNEVLNEKVHLFPIPDAYLANYSQPLGTRFAANAIYKGTNKKSGASISYFLNPSLFEKTKKEKEEKTTPEEKEKSKYKFKKKVGITVLDFNNDTVRVFTIKADTGFNQVNWNLNENGVPGMKYKKHDKKKGLPGGNIVKPGIYKVIVTYKDQSDIAEVNVLSDPRVEFDLFTETKKEGLLKQHKDLSKLYFDISERLNNSRNTINLVQSNLKTIQDTSKKEIEKQIKQMNDSIKTYFEWFILPENFKDYDHVTQRISNKLDNSKFYINSIGTEVTQMSILSLEQLAKEIGIALKRINRFYEKDWQTFEDEYKKLSPIIFEDLEPLKLQE